MSTPEATPTPKPATAVKVPKRRKGEPRVQETRPLEPTVILQDLSQSVKTAFAAAATKKSSYGKWCEILGEKMDRMEEDEADTFMLAVDSAILKMKRGEYNFCLYNFTSVVSYTIGNAMFRKISPAVIVYVAD